MNPILQRDLLEILSRIRSNNPTCSIDNKQCADVCCCRCGGIFSWNKITFVASRCIFVCHRCHKDFIREERQSRLFGILRTPFFYIFLTLLLTLSLYAAGVGRTTISKLQLNDRGRPFYMQKLPYLYMQRAERASNRIQLLQERGPRHEIPRWCELALESLNHAAESWQSTSVAPELDGARAIILAKARRYRESYDILRVLDGDIAPECQLTFLYYRGLVSGKIGLHDHQRVDWETVLQVGLTQRFDIVDIVSNLVNQRAASYSRHMTEEMWRDRVRKMAGLTLPDSYIFRSILIEIRRQKIESAIAEKFIVRFGVDAGLPAPVNSRPPPLVETLNE